MLFHYEISILQYINNIIIKNSKLFVRAFTNFNSLKPMLTMYQAYVSNKIDFASVVWNLQYTALHRLKHVSFFNVLVINSPGWNRKYIKDNATL